MIALQVRVADDQPPKGMRRAHRRLMKDVHGAIGKMWLRQFLPLHFRAGNAARYNHQPRKPATQARKRRRRRRVIDNVDKGLARRIALRTVSVRAFPTRATIQFPGPSYFTMRRRDPSKPHMAAETLRITGDEHRRLTRRGGRMYEAGLKKLRATKTKTIKA